jgi:VWFA-related protein
MMTAALGAIALCAAMPARAQSGGVPPGGTQSPAAREAGTQATPPQSPTITARSNLVLVPALVKTKSGEVVFSLSANDFTLTDNGVPQKLRMEDNTDSQPMAVVVIVETGGEGAWHLRDYQDLGGVLDAIIGGVRHRIAVVSFDSKPRLEQPFTADTDDVTDAIAGLHDGDEGAAILDALTFGIDLLREAPPQYRRAVILFSETADGGSQTSIEDAVRAVSSTNTAIYSFGFSSTRAAVNHEASKIPLPGGTPYGDTPYGPGGCMSKAPGADPDAHGNRKVQALDCASDLLPPLRLARMAFVAAKEGMKKNVPESVAQMTGGEYFAFKNEKTLQSNLIAVSNEVANYYVLSFRPQDPTPGMHALDLKLKGDPDVVMKARTAYWVEGETPASTGSGGPTK